MRRQSSASVGSPVSRRRSSLGYCPSSVSSRRSSSSITSSTTTIKSVNGISAARKQPRKSLVQWDDTSGIDLGSLQEELAGIVLKDDLAVIGGCHARRGSVQLPPLG